MGWGEVLRFVLRGVATQKLTDADVQALERTASSSKPVGASAWNAVSYVVRSVGCQAAP